MMQSKVNVPWTEAKAAQLIQLADAIIKKHQDEGVNSPLKGSLVAEMSFKNNAAKQKHQEGMRYMRIALDAFRERDSLLGISFQQKDVNANSLQYHIKCIRDFLQENYPQNNELLKNWGFDSVIHETI